MLARQSPLLAVHCGQQGYPRFIRTPAHTHCPASKPDSAPY